MESDTITVGVLGASGYGGGEVVRLLADHPSFDVRVVAAHASVGQALAAVHPHLAGLPQGGLTLEAVDAPSIAERVDLVFSALPNGTSSTVAPALLAGGTLVVDLAGDFRLPAEDYPSWYGFEHPAPAWLDEAVYGLPELFGGAVAGAKLVASPGCFPTPAILGLAPLLAAGLVEPGTIRVDGKTGTSGAGRAAVESTSFAATDGSIRPYRAPGHQHTPEIERGLALASGQEATVLFVPHLVPTVRGVVVTAYAPLAAGVDTEALTACLAAAYEGQTFVRVLPSGEMVDAKRTRGSNVVELQAFADPRTGTAVVAGAVDNLIKGAAGQAIQNANLLVGLPHETGLPAMAVAP